MSTKRIFAGVTIVTTAVMMFSGSFAPAFGLTVEELQQQIADLQAQLLQYQSQLEELQGGESATPVAYEGIPDGFTFQNALKYGMSGDEVKYLQIILKAEIGAPTYPDSVGATGWFGPITKSSVIAFQEKYADDILASWGLTHGTGYVGQTTRAKLNELLAGSTVPTPPAPSASDFDNETDCSDAGFYWYDEACHETEQGASTGGTADLVVGLSADNPVAATVIVDSTDGDGAQSLIPFIAVDFTNNGDADATITELKFTRIGIASDTDLSQLYLYNGGTLLAEYSSFDDKVVTFSDSAGLFTVGAGSTKTITLKGDIANGTGASKTIGFKLNADTDITSDAASVGGDFPLAGNLMATAQVSDLGKLTVADSNSYNSTVDPGETNYDLFEFTFTCADQDVEIDKLTFTNVGSVDDNDIQNLKLVGADGTQYGDTVAQLDGGKVTFDIADSPISLTKGDTNKYFYLKGDIIGGTNRNYRFSFQNMTDLVVKDLEYGVYIRANQSDSWSIVQADGATSINTGTLTITRSTDSPSGNIAQGATGVEMAKFNFTATGEDVKVRYLSIYVTRATDSDGTNEGLNDVKLYLDGVQKDTTRDITGDGSGNATQFSFGNTFVVKAGETKVLTVKADVKDYTDGGNIDADDTVKISIAADSDGAQGKSSMADIAVTQTDGLTLTVKSGALTSAKNNALPDASASTPTGVPGSTNVLLASFTITAGAGEGVDISSLKIGDTGSAFSDLQNIVVKTSDGTQIGSTQGTVTAGSSYSFYPSPKISLAKGAQVVINVYGDIKTGATATSASVDLDEVRGTGQDTGSSANDLTSRTGQNIYITSTGSLTVTLAADRPVAAMLVMGDTSQTIGKFKFRETSAAEDVIVTGITLTEIDGAATADLSNIKLYDGSTLLASKADIGSSGNVAFSGLNWTIPAGGTKYLTVKADVGVYGVATSGSDVGFKISSGNVTARGAVSGTSISSVPASDRTGNEFEIWKGVPTITTSGVSLDGRTLTSGANDLFKFQITATGGTVDFYQWKFTYATSGATAAGTWKLYNNTDGAYEDTSCSTSGAVITCQATSGEEIAAGATKTYTLKNTNITGVDTAGDSVSVYMNSDTSTYGGTLTTATTTAAAGNFAWSDESNTSHATSTADWTNGYLLENDDEYTSTQTSSK